MNQSMLPPKCEIDNHYMASPHFISLSLHSLSCIAVPLHVFGFYCILYKTPKPMNSVKWQLLNLHFWSVVLDTVLTVLAIPYAIFPAMAGYGLGPVDSPGIYLYLIVTIINTVTLSIMSIFEDRYHLLFAEKTWWSKVRKPFIIIAFILNPLYFLPPQFFIPDQQIARELILTSLSCVPELPANRDLFVLSLDNKIPGISVFFCGGTATVAVSIFFNLLIHNLLNIKPNSRLSQRTIEMQRKLAIALIVQCSATTIWFTAPIIFVFGIAIFDYHNQAMNNLVFIFVSSHGFCSTIIMVLAHKPYRDFTLAPIYRLCRKDPVVFVTSKTSSRNII